MKKLLFFSAACALFVIGCGDKATDDAAAGTTGATTTTGKAADTAGGGTAGTTASTAAATAGDTSAPSGAAGAGGFAGAQAILTKNCVMCHGATNPKAGINLTTYEGVMKGGGEGPVVTAGDPDNSVIMQALQGTHGKKQMPPPPKGKLSDADQKTISDWIKAGAKA